MFLINGRFLDAAFAAARSVGICNANIESNWSLGLSSNGPSLADIWDKGRMEGQSLRSGVIVVVDIPEFIWKGLAAPWPFPNGSCPEPE